MNKHIYWGVLLLCTLMVLPCAAAGSDQDNSVTTKTYELRYVSARSIRSIINPYILQAGHQDGSPLMVVTLRKENIKALEDLLTKLDQPKQNIAFRIFTVIASLKPNDKPTQPMHPDLKNVIEELSKVLGYKTYRLDGVSTLIVQDGAERNELELNSQVDDLNLTLYAVNLSRGETPDKKLIRAGMQLREVFGGVIVEKDRQVINRTLLTVDQVQLKEGGYLVAGVSKLGSDGDALVLVINATVE